MTALMNAINKNDISLVERLIQNGADIDELDEKKDSPLVIAAYKGYNQIVKILLEKGADVSAVDPGMKATALHAAAYAGRTEAAKLLVDFHIDVNKQGPYNGYTALHDAIWQNNIEVVKVLLDAGADLNLLSNDGKSALDFAQSRNRNEIITLIRNKSGK
ncbi:ankyrin repeat domain-containing protein [Dyadobacter sp. CY356]|uniref:ankyrin repeat domain-containing protein n=1 Tax=Dyadobacter sp. CY356 TaxID=2906442 RepID=UPI001F358B67|nr:ankyrin repeat domain-containing protein [Dyadobacter sp. CY356]